MDKVVICKTLCGSHLFGTSTPSSDLDYKSVAIPSKRDILLGNYAKTAESQTTKVKEHTKNTKDDIDTEEFSLKGFVRLLQEGQTVALEILFSPEHLNAHPVFNEFFLTNKTKWLHKNVGAFYGYARSQAAKYSVKGSRLASLEVVINALKNLPLHSKLGEHSEVLNNLIVSTPNELGGHIEVQGLEHQGRMVSHLYVCNKYASFESTVKYALTIYENIYKQYGHRAKLAQENTGIDWKALSHAVRVGGQCIELLRDHTITLPRPDATRLLAIKQGQVRYQEVAEEIERLLFDIKDAREKSSLPEKLDQQLADDVVAELHYRKIKGEL